MKMKKTLFKLNITWDFIFVFLVTLSLISLILVGINRSIVSTSFNKGFENGFKINAYDMDFLFKPSTIESFCIYNNYESGDVTSNYYSDEIQILCYTYNKDNTLIDQKQYNMEEYLNLKWKKQLPQ